MIVKYNVDCPECGAVLALEAEEEELKAEDGAVIECEGCKVETEYEFSDFYVEIPGDAEEEDDDEDDEPDTDDDEDDEV